MLTSQAIRELCAGHSAAHPKEFFYCLVDHAGMPGLHKMLLRTNADWISLFEGTKEANALAVAPLLFRMELDPQNSRNNRLLTWVGERGTYSSSVLLLASPLPLRELARRLNLRLDGRISEDIEVLIRFYDPRVFEQLMLVLSVEEKHSFLSGASRWWFIDRSGAAQTVNTIFLNDDRFIPPFCLSEGHEAALLDASEPDQVAEQLRNCVPDEYASLPQPERYKFIADQIVAARGFGIVATHELALFCALSLRYGLGFAQSPRWQSIFAEIRCGRTSLTDAVTSSI